MHPHTRQMMGFDTPGDQKIEVTARDWDAMKRAVWRGHKALEIIAKSADEIVDACAHVDGCPGAASDTEPCTLDRYEPRPVPLYRKIWSWLTSWTKQPPRLLPEVDADSDDELAIVVPRAPEPERVLVAHGCADRELRMSALVILAAAQQASPTRVARPADEPYFAPSREYFSEVLSSLGAAQIQAEIDRAEIARLREELACLTKPRPTGILLPPEPLVPDQSP